MHLIKNTLSSARKMTFLFGFLLSLLQFTVSQSTFSCPKKCICTEPLYDICFVSKLNEIVKLENGTTIKQLRISVCNLSLSTFNTYNVLKVQSSCEKPPLSLFDTFSPSLTYIDNHKCHYQLKSTASNCSLTCPSPIIYKGRCVCEKCKLLPNEDQELANSTIFPTSSLSDASMLPERTSVITTSLGLGATVVNINKTLPSVAFNKTVTKSVKTSLLGGKINLFVEPSKKRVYGAQMLKGKTEKTRLPVSKTISFQKSVSLKMKRSKSVQLKSTRGFISETPINAIATKFSLNNDSIFLQNRSNGEGNITNTFPKKHKYNFYFIIAIASISSLALIVNMFLMTQVINWQKVLLFEVFGFFLMLYNVVLACYGITLAVYLAQDTVEWEMRFCQGITSVKLFSLGTIVWTIIMLMFHFSIRSSGDEKDNRDAVFKGIVYVLEGLMLSGVLSVMSWIKLDSWNYLCSIINPITNLEWMLVGIEVLHYSILFLLIIRYPIHLFRREKVTSACLQEYRKYEPLVFLMIFLTFVVWTVTYILTLAEWRIFDMEMAAVIRVCGLMVPLLFQPMMICMKNTWCCKCCCQKPEDDELGKVSTSDVSRDTSPFGENYSRTTSSQEAKEANKKNKKHANKSPVKRETTTDRKTSKSLSIDDATENCPLLDEPTTPLSPAKSPKLQALFPSDQAPLLDDTDSRRKAPVADVDSTPVKSLESPRRGNTEFPSFISMEAGGENEENNKKDAPRLKELKEESLIEEGRVSRGPTFYAMPEKKKPSDESPQSIERKLLPDNHLELKMDEPNNKENNKKSFLKKSKPKTGNESKKGKKKLKKTDSIEMGAPSEASLEWDHSYSSSGSADIPPGNNTEWNADKVSPVCAWEPYESECVRETEFLQPVKSEKEKSKGKSKLLKFRGKSKNERQCREDVETNT